MGTIVSSFNTLVGSAVVSSTDLIPMIWQQSSGSLKNRVITVGQLMKLSVGLRTTLFKVGSQSIGTGATAQITWSSAIDDVGGVWNASSPGIWLVPPGFSKMSVLAHGNWTSASSGRRLLALVGSTANISAANSSWYQATFEGPGNGECHMQLKTRVFSVTSGQPFMIGGYQESGGNLNFNSASYGGDAFVEITWLP